MSGDEIIRGVFVRKVVGEAYALRHYCDDLVRGFEAVKEAADRAAECPRCRRVIRFPRTECDCPVDARDRLNREHGIKHELGDYPDTCPICAEVGWPEDAP